MMQSGYSEKKRVIAHRLIKHFSNENCSVGDFLGIQSQFLRYSKMVALTRNIDIEQNPENYFRAWSLRGTMHIHQMDDYGLFVHKNMLSTYINEYWNNAPIEYKRKKRFVDLFLTLIDNGITEKKKIISCMYAEGMSPQEKEYLFNAWGGMPRYLVEKGEIVLTVNNNISYLRAPCSEREKKMKRFKSR